MRPVRRRQPVIAAHDGPYTGLARALGHQALLVIEGRPVDVVLALDLTLGVPGARRFGEMNERRAGVASLPHEPADGYAVLADIGGDEALRRCDGDRTAANTSVSEISPASAGTP